VGEKFYGAIRVGMKKQQHQGGPINGSDADTEDKSWTEGVPGIRLFIWEPLSIKAGGGKVSRREGNQAGQMKIKGN